MKNKVAIAFMMLLIGPIVGHGQYLGKSFMPAAPGNSAFLATDEYLVSPGKNFVLIMQGDGNLVLYKGSGPKNLGQPIWNTQTSIDGNIESFLAMQEDGNLVVYRGTPQSNKGHVWNAGSVVGRGHYYLALQDDGNLVVYRGVGPNDNRGAVWSVSTGLITRQNGSQCSGGKLNKADTIQGSRVCTSLHMNDDGTVIGITEIWSGNPWDGSCVVPVAYLFDEKENLVGQIRASQRCVGAKDNPFDNPKHRRDEWRGKVESPSIVTGAVIMHFSGGKNPWDLLKENIEELGEVKKQIAKIR